MESQEAKAIIEALLFVSDVPLTVKRIAGILSNCTNKEIERLLLDLQQDYNRLAHGIQLIKVAGGYQFATRPQLAGWVSKFYKEKESRGLSAPALETLAIIAYKQPVMRAEIEAVRGVDVSGMLNSLLDKALIKIVGRHDGPGKPLLYGTSEEFLLYFGLDDLSGLPKDEDLLEKKDDLAAPE